MYIDIHQIIHVLHRKYKFKLRLKMSSSSKRYLQISKYFGIGKDNWMRNMSMLHFLQYCVYLRIQVLNSIKNFM